MKADEARTLALKSDQERELDSILEAIRNLAMAGITDLPFWDCRESATRTFLSGELSLMGYKVTHLGEEVVSVKW